MTSNEERIARLEGTAEETRSQLADIRAELRSIRQELHAEIGSLRGEMGGLRGEMGDLRAEIRSSRNTVLMVVLVLWMTTIGTLFGLFFGAGTSG